MTWAIGYYNAYRFELSKNVADDMIIDDVVDLAVGNANVTLVDVLQAMISAANAGYSELMIVAHGSPKGLIMPMAPGMGSADKDNLPKMTEIAGIVAERDRIGAISNATQQLAEWVTLLKRVSGSNIAGGAQWGPITANQLSAISSGADARKWLETLAPTVNGQSILTDQSSVTLFTLRNQIVQKKLKRVEVRACNLGGDAAGMTALREFLGAAVVLAPMVKTFYGHVSPILFTRESDYISWVTRNAAWLLNGRPDPGNTRTYLGDSLFLKMDAKATTPLSVLKLWQPGFQSCAGVAGHAGNYAMIKSLVVDNIDVKNTSNYQGGPFYVGGLDPVAGRTTVNPPPAAASGKAFLLASEPEYRAMIVSNP